jgi:cytoskeletal protein RodZ
MSEEEAEQTIRRRDLKKLGDTFEKSMRPLCEVLQHMKALNNNWTVSNRQLKHVLRFQLLLLLLSLGSLALLGLAAQHMQQALLQLADNTEKLQQVQGSVQATVEELRKVRTSTSNTEEVVEAVKKEQDARPQLELVPEPDPVKARRTPVRLRVLPPVQAPLPVPSASLVPSASASAVAEIPLPAAEGF